jgi:hypothetical protein
MKFENIWIPEHCQRTEVCSLFKQHDRDGIGRKELFSCTGAGANKNAPWGIFCRLPHGYRVCVSLVTNQKNVFGACPRHYVSIPTDCVLCSGYVQLYEETVKWHPCRCDVHKSGFKCSLGLTDSWRLRSL